MEVDNNGVGPEHQDGGGGAADVDEVHNNPPASPGRDEDVSIISSSISSGGESSSASHNGPEVDEERVNDPGGDNDMDNYSIGNVVTTNDDVEDSNDQASAESVERENPESTILGDKRLDSGVL